MFSMLLLSAGFYNAVMYALYLVLHVDYIHVYCCICNVLI